MHGIASTSDDKAAATCRNAADCNLKSQTSNPQGVLYEGQGHLNPRKKPQNLATQSIVIEEGINTRLCSPASQIATPSCIMEQQGNCLGQNDTAGCLSDVHENVENGWLQPFKLDEFEEKETTWLFQMPVENPTVSVGDEALFCRFKRTHVENPLYGESLLQDSPQVANFPYCTLVSSRCTQSAVLGNLEERIEKVYEFILLHPFSSSID